MINLLLYYPETADLVSYDADIDSKHTVIPSHQCIPSINHIQLFDSRQFACLSLFSANTDFRVTKCRSTHYRSALLANNAFVSLCSLRTDIRATNCRTTFYTQLSWRTLALSYSVPCKLISVQLTVGHHTPLSSCGEQWLCPPIVLFVSIPTHQTACVPLSLPSTKTVAIVDGQLFVQLSAHGALVHSQCHSTF